MYCDKDSQWHYAIHDMKAEEFKVVGLALEAYRTKTADEIGAPDMGISKKIVLREQYDIAGEILSHVKAPL